MTTKRQEELPPCLELYRLRTDPSPLKVSTPSSAESGAVDIHVTGLKDVFCKQIEFAIPIGDGANAFSKLAPDAAVNTAKWTIGLEKVVNGGEIGLAEDTDYALYMAKCRNAPDYDIDYPLRFTFTGIVNMESGTFLITVYETSKPSPQQPDWEDHQCELPGYKAAPVFYLLNFVAQTAKSAEQPITEVERGTPVDFSWESNGTYYRVYMKGFPKPVYCGPETQFTFDSTSPHFSDFRNDTTFFLVATEIDQGLEEASQVEGTEKVLYDALTLTVTNPILKSLEVEGEADFGDRLTVKGPLETEDTATFDKDVHVKSSATVDGALNAQGNAGIKGTLTVGGTTSLQGTEVHGALGVGGVASLIDATISGLLRASGVVQMLGPCQKIDFATYTAKTDGFVLGIIGWPDNAGKKCYGVVQGWTEGMRCHAFGGNYVFWMSSHMTSAWSGSLGNTFLMPVRKGQTWGADTWFWDKNDVNPPCRLYWIPVGSEQAETLESVPATEAPKPATADVPKFIALGGEES